MRAGIRIVVGVGNEFRRDDGVGPALLAELAARGLDGRPGVRLVHSAGDPAGLVDAWSGVELAVVVDAEVRRPAHPGRVHRTVVDGPLPHGSGPTSHGLGVPEAVGLATALGRLPQRLVVFAVEVADVGMGVGLTPEVAAAVPGLADAVAAEIEAPAT